MKFHLGKREVLGIIFLIICAIIVWILLPPRPSCPTTLIPTAAPGPPLPHTRLPHAFDL